MNRWKLWLTSLVAVAALGVLGACGDDGGSGDDDDDDDDMVDAGPMDGGIDPDVLACRNAIAAREAEVSSSLPFDFGDADEMIGPNDGDQNLEGDFAGKYRDDLANHPGCVPRASYDGNSEPLVNDNMATVPAGTPANIPGYPCAAKVYTQEAEDTTKPIVILVHGNSSGVPSFEEYFNETVAGSTLSNVAGFEFTADATVRTQLASTLLEDGYQVISFDARTDLVATLGDYNPDATTGNAFLNIDHGWAVPMLQALIKAVMTQNPSRKVSLVTHSLGTTVARDALRRLYVESKSGVAGAVNPYARLQDLVYLSGANHGVASGQLLCDSFGQQMRGTVGCEMGDRQTFVPTYFTQPINGPGDLFATPCADGSYAFGERDQCEGNVVQYSTVTMEDLPDGALQDEFVSEESSQLDLEPCVDNDLVTLGDYDRSGYFFLGFHGFFANHFGTPRSDTGIALVAGKLAN